MKWNILCGLLVLLIFTGGRFAVANGPGNKSPNVIFIICDDLNDYVEGLGGHPQTQTPHLARLSKSGVSFRQAHCNIPICGPSRASLFTGIYPHNSGCFGFTKWDGYPVLKNSRTIMDHFRANGYQTLGTGKLMHHLVRRERNEYGQMADYGPFAFDGTERVAHPDVPSPYREIGAVDGSFGPLISLTNREMLKTPTRVRFAAIPTNWKSLAQPGPTTWGHDFIKIWWPRTSLVRWRSSISCRLTWQASPRSMN